VNGRKRHLLVDGLGLVLLVIVHAARVQEQAGAQRVFERLPGRHPRLRLGWADAGYKVQWLLDWVQTTCAWILEMVSRPEGSQGFVLLPRRWVVERSFGWLSHYRVLSKDYAVLPRNREAVVYVAMIPLMVRRLACQTTTTPP
jgi:putative transposase